METRKLATLTGDVETIRCRLNAHSAAIKTRVVGQEDAIDHLLVALVSAGHVLLEGAPGLGKTRLARLLCGSLEGTYKRLQFTPDLLPGDLIGSSIYDSASGRFRFQRGPVFANYVLADEINRAPAKIQSALLEAMEERQVTSGEESHPLEPPFFVIATQNPIEHDGTWDLPQAQLDRFMMRIDLAYPEVPTELEILGLALDEAISEPAGEEAPVIPKSDLLQAQKAAARTFVSDPIRGYIARLVSATRGATANGNGVARHLSHPVSPRGSVMLARAAQSRAWLAGRDHVLPGDVQALAPGVLRHRIGLSYRAEADGVLADSIVTTLLERVDVI